jgi:hypothetical protein
MYIHKPKVILRARLNMSASQNYPLDVLIFDTVTLGNTTLLKESMTLLLGSAADKHDYGMVRYRYMDPDFPSTQMHVSRYSQGTGIGELNLVDNAYITVLEDYRVWAKIPQMAGGAMWKDTDISSELNNGKPPAVPNGGPGTAGDIDPGTGRLEVAFSAQSFIFNKAFTPPTPNPNNYIWELPGTATVVAGNVTTANVTARFLPGFYYVYLTVHDWGLNHAETQKIPIFARDPASDLSTTEFRVVSHQHDQVGQEITIELYKPLPRNTYYDGFLMMMWDDSITYVPVLRRHMQFIGWHQAEDVSIRTEATATLDDTRLTFYDVGKRLEMLPGFSQVMKYAATVGVDWSESEFANMLYYFWFLLHYHSTALEVADFFDYSFSLSLYEFVVIGSDKQNLSAQIQELAAKVSPDHRMSCNRQGQLKMIPDLNIMHTADRPSTVMDTVSDSLWVSVTWGYSQQPKVGQIQTMAIVSSHETVMVGDKETLEVVACVAPGTGYGQGEQMIEAGERICFEQFNLNNVEGNRYAKMNARFAPFTITVPWELLDPDVSPAEAQWLRLTISDANHPIREATGFTDLRGIVLEMTTEYQVDDTGLSRMVTIQWEMESSGHPAETVILWPDVPEETP